MGYNDAKFEDIIARSNVFMEKYGDKLNKIKIITEMFLENSRNHRNIVTKLRFDIVPREKQIEKCNSEINRLTEYLIELTQNDYLILRQCQETIREYTQNFNTALKKNDLTYYPEQNWVSEFTQTYVIDYEIDIEEPDGSFTSFSPYLSYDYTNIDLEELSDLIFDLSSPEELIQIPDYAILFEIIIVLEDLFDLYESFYSFQINGDFALKIHKKYISGMESYTWQSHSQKEMQNEIDSLFELLVDENLIDKVTIEDFTLVFSGVKVDRFFTPINWPTNNIKQLLYFIDSLRKNNKILHKKNMDYVKLRYCFTMDKSNFQTAKLGAIKYELETLSEDTKSPINRIFKKLNFKN